MEMTEPCENPDAYRYILQYHCGDDMDPGSSSHPDDDSSSHDGMDSRRPGPSSTHYDGSSSHDGMDSRRPDPSSSHIDQSSVDGMSDARRPDPSSSRIDQSSVDGMSDSRRPDPSSSHIDQSSVDGMSDSRRPVPSSELHGSSQLMSGADQGPSGSVYPSRTQPGQGMSSGYNTGPDHHTNTPRPQGDACM